MSLLEFGSIGSVSSERPCAPASPWDLWAEDEDLEELLSWFCRVSPLPVLLSLPDCVKRLLVSYPMMMLWFPVRQFPQETVLVVTPGEGAALDSDVSGQGGCCIHGPGRPSTGEGPDQTSGPGRGISVSKSTLQLWAPWPGL
ncbi:hypothetical protein P7K49_014911 [Saguinus oedipus]|uniref:Uncharacterized protein n=1 Tax=Saguinus oedipus TaxID=9490 RepID=A0ABQ9VAF6_SAGOE|nr:hypothetical protein P7K49_014911 [Saguinus oedipus]